MSDSQVSRSDLLSHDDTCYNPHVGKLTSNPEKQVVHIRIEIR